MAYGEASAGGGLYEGEMSSALFWAFSTATVNLVIWIVGVGLGEKKGFDGWR